MKGKNSPEKILTEISKLEVTEFLGVCKILGIELYDIDMKLKDKNGEAAKVDAEVTPKEFEKIWEEMCDIVWEMNRTRRRNLGKLIYSATRGKED